jgi:hypothetical protein
MIYGALIENGIENEILLCEKIDANEQVTWSLPHLSSDDDILCSIAKLINKCHDEYNVSIEIEASSKHYENSDFVVLEAKLCSYSFLNDYTGIGYRWVKIEKLSKLNIDEDFKLVFGALLQKYSSMDSIRKAVVETISAVSSKLYTYYSTDIQEQKEAINVFIKSPNGVFCPFGFRLDFSIDETDQIQYVTSIFITRTPDSGDKTDIYILFSNSMAIIQKIFGCEKIYIDYLSLFDEAEINSASLIFLNKLNRIKLSDLSLFKSLIQDTFLQFTTSLFIFSELIGSFNTELNEENYCQRYFDYLCLHKDLSNSQARKELQFYSDFGQGITLLCILNKEYREDFFAAISWEIIDGIDGKILCQINTDKGYLSFNFISNETWSKVCQVINDLKIKKYTFLCQSNALYMFEGKNIWIFEGDFSEYWVSEEKMKLIDRQNRESMILNLNRQFEWAYPLNYSRFEELIADLFEREELVQSVRLLGKSNCPDGGRDVLIWKTVRTGENSFGSKLIIGQCKAYNRSVNKRDVTDIRDTIENYDAAGFHLFVSSSVTASLIDNLIKLKERYESDWWTEREIFKRLRQHTDISERYLDIITIVDESALYASKDEVKV